MEEVQVVDLDVSQIHVEMMEEQLSSSLVSEKVVIDTPYGGVSVTVQGEKGNPAIVTYHDIGLNHGNNFGSFLSSRSMEPLAERFCWYHINAPGQEFGAEKLPADFVYPTMTQLAEQIDYILDYYQLGDFIGLGVGAGANILARYAMLNEECVRGLVLINFNPEAMSWTSPIWLSGKAVKWQLKRRETGVSRLAATHLKMHTFGLKSVDSESDLMRVYMEELSTQQPHNLSLFMDSYYNRSNLIGDFVKLVNCPCLFIVSETFMHKETMIKLCSLLSPEKSTYLEISNTSGLLLNDQPTKVATALRLFLQGLGLALALSASSVCPSLHTSMVLEGVPAILHPTTA